MGLLRTARDVVSFAAVQHDAELDAAATVPGPRGDVAGGPWVGAPLRPWLGSPWSVPPALAPVVIADVFGLDVWPVSRSEAMSVPAMSRARNLLCVLTARQPLRSYLAGDALTDPQPSWIARTDVRQSTFHRMVWTVDDLLFYGRSCWLLERSASTGFPLIADRVDIDSWELDDDLHVVIDGQRMDDDTVCVIDSFNEGVLGYGARSIRMASGLDRAALDTARAPFKLELHQTSDDPLNDDEIDRLVDRARQAIADNRGILYTNAHLEAIVHAYTADNLLTEGRNASAIDMARLANVPAAAVDAVLSGSGITYQTGPSLNRSLIDYGAGGFMSAISARLSQNDITPNGQRVAFDLEAFLDPIPDNPAVSPTRQVPPVTNPTVGSV